MDAKWIKLHRKAVRNTKRKYFILNLIRVEIVEYFLFGYVVSPFSQNVMYFYIGLRWTQSRRTMAYHSVTQNNHVNGRLSLAIYLRKLKLINLDAWLVLLKLSSIKYFSTKPYESNKKNRTLAVPLWTDYKLKNCMNSEFCPLLEYWHVIRILNFSI